MAEDRREPRKGLFHHEIDIDTILQELETGPFPAAPELLPVVLEALGDRGVSFQRDSDDQGVRFQLRGETLGYLCHIRVNNAQGVVCCYIQPAFWVPEAARAPVAEAVTRANYGLPLGNFELDLRDGELRYKTGIDVEGGLLVRTMVDNLVSCGFTMCNRYVPAFLRVAYGDTPPAEATAEVEE